VLLALYELADAADVDLEISSLWRPSKSDAFSWHSQGLGQAADITAVNGIDIGQWGTFNQRGGAALADGIRRVQAAAAGLPGIRENYGPSRVTQGSAMRFDQLSGHLDHIHLGFRF
jgi:hypothetical protein